MENTSDNLPTDIDIQGLPEVQPKIHFGTQENFTNNSNTIPSEVFDPAIHAVDKFGNPSKTKTGKFRKKTISKRKDAQEFDDTTPTGTPDTVQNRKAAAAAATAATFQLGMLIAGNEAMPYRDTDRGIDEEQQMFFAYDKYFEAKGIHDFPPGVALCIALGGYSLRVLATNSGKSRAKSVYHGAKFKLGNLFKRKKKDEIQGSRADSGDNEQRENNSGNGESASVQRNGDSVDSARPNGKPKVDK